ncbi:hypothetical protein Pcinc_002438, partial [Petrolisthes cinctipes]
EPARSVRESCRRLHHFTLVQCGRSCKVVDDHRHLHHTDSLKRQFVASCLVLSYSGLERKKFTFYVE